MFNDKFNKLQKDLITIAKEVTELKAEHEKLEKEYNSLNAGFDKFLNDYIEIGLDKTALLKQLPHTCIYCKHFNGYDKFMKLKCDLGEGSCSWEWKGREKKNDNNGINKPADGSGSGQ